ncbi:hypothetical protein NXT3_PB00374 (plasmid) [Sinorhizobium fredii]|uniref:Uncharacterized protein n=1 Tax=Rhizobium fredii TaxID=380 RepID=A0A2L0HE43_RHIFR|nr:hypothetical protein NXT3_PB00374 [Sinorhizobium fredii]
MTPVLAVDDRQNVSTEVRTYGRADRLPAENCRGARLDRSTFPNTRPQITAMFKFAFNVQFAN